MNFILQSLTLKYFGDREGFPGRRRISGRNVMRVPRYENNRVSHLAHLSPCRIKPRQSLAAAGPVAISLAGRGGVPRLPELRLAL